MKLTFIRLMLATSARPTGNTTISKPAETAAPAAESVKPTEPAKPAEKVYTSDKLTELKTAKNAAFVKMQQIDPSDEKAANEAYAEVSKLMGDIKAEIASLQQIERDADLQEKRNARVALLDGYYQARVTRDNPPATATETDKTAAEEAFKKVEEQLHNFLLAGIGASKPATTGAASLAGTGTKSAQILQMMIAGNTYEQMIAAGMGDGTIRTVAGNEKYRKNADGTYTKKA